MSSDLASMDYFNTRARAYSNPTVEELRMLEYLKFQFQFSPQLAQDQYIQQRDPRQVMFCDLTQFGTGLPSPIDTPEDSEMSGTENIEPWIQPPSTTTSSFTALTPLEPSSHMFPRRSIKRKHLADRDDNISTLSPRSFLSSKRPRCDQHQYTLPLPSPHKSTLDDKTNCMNCGRSFAPSGNRHNCIYHPGEWICEARSPDWKLGYWSCCRSSLTDCGCLISRHLPGNLGDLPGGRSRAVTGVPKQNIDMGQHSQFAIMYRSGSLGPRQDLDVLML